VAIRHDVDKNIAQSLKMAQLEAGNKELIKKQHSMRKKQPNSISICLPQCATIPEVVSFFAHEKSSRCGNYCSED